MKFLVAPTAFKGTLSPSEASSLLCQTLRKKHPNIKFESIPLADGGDGTLEVFLASKKGKQISTKVKGPHGKDVRATWALLKDRSAVLEMAQASGLALIKGKNNVLTASSFGTGELIRAALNRKCRKIWVGVGGTATADGGAGALEALGLRYFDKKRVRLKAHPRDLIRLHTVDWSGFDPRINKTKIFVLCDVKNPLLGPQGSARVFGPQKGATQAQVLFLERFLRQWSRHAKSKTQNNAGSGAAGALAFGLSGFAHAKLKDGANEIFNALDWDKRVKKYDGIITGEGKLDKTSFQGKVIGTVCARRARKNVWVVCGKSTLSTRFLRTKGIRQVFQCGKQGILRPKTALRNAAANLKLL